MPQTKMLENKINELSEIILEKYLIGVFKQFTKQELITILFAGNKVNAANLPDGSYNAKSLAGIISEEEYYLLEKWYEFIPSNIRKAITEMPPESCRDMVQRVYKAARL